MEHSYVAGNLYKGLHLLAQHPSGRAAELQLHSAESLTVKNANHGDYKIERDEYHHSLGDRAAAYRRMVTRSGASSTRERFVPAVGGGRVPAEP